MSGGSGWAGPSAAPSHPRVLGGDGRCWGRADPISSLPPGRGRHAGTRAGSGHPLPSTDCGLSSSSVYRCGSAQGWSRRFRFRALKNGAHWSPRLAVYGDMGADNAKALPRLRRDTQQGMYDAILHVGEASARVRRARGAPSQDGSLWGACRDRR